jgi:outer membrane protein assembly factor BamB
VVERRARRPSVVRTGIGCLIGGLSAAALLIGAMAIFAYFELRDLGSSGEGSGPSFPVPNGLSPPSVDTLRALDTGTGDERWRKHIGHDAEFVGVAGDLAVVHESDRHELVALDLQTGAQRWRGPALVHGFCSPIVDGSVVIGVTFHGELVAQDVQTGAKVWQTKAAASWECASLVGADGTVVVSGSVARPHEAFAAGYDTATGSERWRQDGSMAPGLFLHGSNSGLVFAAAGHGAIDALEAATGAVRWRWAPPQPVRNDLLLVAIDVRAVTAGSSVGFSAADPEARRGDTRTITVFVDVQDGVERWRTKSGAASSFAYDSTTDTLVELGEPPVPIARNPATGAVLSTGSTPGESLVAADGMAYVGDGNVTALNEHAAASIWTNRPGSHGVATVVGVAKGLVLVGSEQS